MYFAHPLPMVCHSSQFPAFLSFYSCDQVPKYSLRHSAVSFPSFHPFILRSALQDVLEYREQAFENVMSSVLQRLYDFDFDIASWDLWSREFQLSAGGYRLISRR